ncbi:energy transducer TonB [Wenzhouxiangella sp. EGI_FJ10305]|uniref:energy transducer TonB n=1 Tax=Wenzhouxiangella sp. EGI_FJ10305 TaxID=3243768 RepID=UPI0035DEEA27
MIHATRLIGLLVCFPAFAVVADISVTNEFDCSEEDREVTPLSRTQPYYPHSAMMYCLSGSVDLEFTIDTQGIPKDISVVESEPAGVFDRAAIDAVERWHFIPACRDGERAERTATQTIEFELPGASASKCRNQFDNANEETARLLGELGARYALLAEIHLGQAPRERLQDSAATPLGRFDGDLDRVARFHERALEHIARIGGESKSPSTSFGDVMFALNPYVLAEHPDLSNLRLVMDEYRQVVARRADHARERHREIKADFQRLARETNLSTQQLERLVFPFLGNVTAPGEAVHRQQLEPLEHLQALVDLLEVSHGSWHAEGGRIVFDSKADQTTWSEQLQELYKRRDEARKHNRNWFRSFQDYSD